MLKLVFVQSFTQYYRLGFVAFLSLAFIVVSTGCDDVIEASVVNASAQEQAATSTGEQESEEKPAGQEKESESTTDVQSDAKNQEGENKTEKPKSETQSKVDDHLDDWISLFDGKTMEGWETIEFGGEGDVGVNDKGALTIEAGDPLTGFSSTRKDLPKTNFEVELEARKTAGIDFFCGLTFPVADSHCTLIVGGWAGSTVGLSCIDDLDASSNDTTKIMKFETDKWYKIRVRVEPDVIKTWIEGKKVIDKNIKGKKVSLRGDTTLCRPLGVCSFMTDAEIRNFRIRKLDVEEK